MPDHGPSAGRVIIWLVVLLVLLWFIRAISWVLGLVVVSLLIVYLLSPVVEALCRTKIPRCVIVPLVYLGFLAVPGVVVYLIIPVVVDQIKELANYLPDALDVLIPWLEETTQHIYVYEPRFVDNLYAMIDDMPQWVVEALGQVGRALNVVLMRVFEALIVLVLVYYLLRDFPGIKKEMETYIPRRYHDAYVHLLGVMDEKVGDFIRGTLVRCTAVGILTGVGLYVLGMPFNVILGILAGLLNILPYIGPYLAGIPAVLLSLAQPFPYPLLVVILYVGVQMVDGVVITPLFLGRAVNLHPLTVILALLIGGRLYGILGLILATPVVAVLKVLILYYRERGDILG